MSKGLHEDLLSLGETKLSSNPERQYKYMHQINTTSNTWLKKIDMTQVFNILGSVVF